MNYIILSSKPWNNSLADSLTKKMKDNWYLIKNKEDFNIDNLKQINPDKIFIPHWSYIIPEEIFNNYTCVVFHMTDLPFGRGGSPLQNLISSGFESTKITAIKVDEGLDSGDVYLKRDLSLFGTAEEIFIRANNEIEDMIIEIVKNNIKPKPQTGESVFFKRRTPSMSNIDKINTLDKLYDQIRMLDADGYPKAFLETECFRFEFSRASYKADNSIIADVKIFLKNK